MIPDAIHICKLQSLRSIGFGKFRCKDCGRGAVKVAHKTINMYRGKEGYINVHYTRNSRKKMKSASNVLRSREKKKVGIGILKRLRTSPCHYCGKYEPGKMTIDHIIPVSKGGRTSENNIVSACAACNNKKGNTIPDNISPEQLAMLDRNVVEIAFPMFKKLQEEKGT